MCDDDFIGNPLEKCWKIGKDLCEPNPCGNSSICVSNDGRRKPYCLCQKGFYGKPPNCRTGCANNTDCSINEVCDESNRCVDPCKPSPCGDNSNCRSGNHSAAICSCLDGFFPESDLGCRPEEHKDTKIDLDLIKDQLRSPCGEKCGKNALCGTDGSCKCSQGFTGDPKVECTVEPKPEVSNKCTPTPCGRFSICDVIVDRYNCSCLEGFLGTPPLCHPCTSSLDCDAKMLCLDQKCVKNPCENFCGKNAECGVKNGKVECSCENNEGNPFKACVKEEIAASSACKFNAVSAECGVAVKSVAKVHARD